MHLAGCDRRWIFLVAFAGLLVPQSVFAAGEAIADTALHDGGTLFGQLIDKEGAPQKAEQVVLRHDRRVVAIAKTNDQGRFAVGGLRAGVYQLETTRGTQLIRLWAADTAPPSAKPTVVMVSGDRIVRGQIDMDKYGPAIRGAIAGGLLTGLTYWAIDYNPEGS